MKKRPETIEDLLRVQHDLMKKQMIIQLGIAGVPQAEIRQIVEVDMGRVNKIVKCLKKAKKNG